MCFKVCFHSSSACLACSPASPAGGNGKVTWQQRIEANVAVTFFDAQAHCGPQLGLQHKTFLPELPSKLQYWYFLRPSLSPPPSLPHTHIHINTHMHKHTYTYIHRKSMLYLAGYWILGASIGGGSFGVFAGGFFSDRVVSRYFAQFRYS